MKKAFVFLFAIVTFSLNAQNFNKWSLDLGGGFHDIGYGLSPVFEISSSYNLNRSLDFPFTTTSKL